MKRFLSSLAVLLAAGFLFALPVHAAPVTLPDGTIFDPEYYAQQNPDVVAALGTSAQMLYQHYLVAGKAEGRLPYAGATPSVTIPAGFDAAFYAASYPDVVAALGTDPATLYLHYVNFGQKEGRKPNASAAGITPQPQPAVQYTGMQFTTKDLYGNTVTAKDLFSANKYTMVNLWATWCGPCKGELAELGVLANEFKAQGCEIVGLLADDEAYYINQAKNLLAANGASYTNLVINYDLYSLFYSNCVPTSFFVDQTGHIVGEPIYGADVYGYTSTLRQLLAR